MLWFAVENAASRCAYWTPARSASVFSGRTSTSELTRFQRTWSLVAVCSGWPGVEERVEIAVLGPLVVAVVQVERGDRGQSHARAEVGELRG